MSINSQEEKVSVTHLWLNRKLLSAGLINTPPKLLIICGSGLGGLAEQVKEPSLSIPYAEIPNFATNTVQGHAGNLLFGTLSGMSVMLMQGRFHYYEGISLQDVTFPIRLAASLGVKSLIVTNASGGLNPNYSIGDIMIIRDHINMLGLAGTNPLIGPNIDDFGPRFPSMSSAYDLKLRKLLRKAAKDADTPMEWIRSGIYVGLGGPSYETMAEARALRSMGADAVGMSTIPEVIVAKHCGMSVVGLALITNKVIMRDNSGDDVKEEEIEETLENEIAATHEEVLDTGRKRAQTMQKIVTKYVSYLCTSNILAKC